jgi:hypothetical protein
VSGSPIIYDRKSVGRQNKNRIGAEMPLSFFHHLRYTKGILHNEANDEVMGF